ncbi:glycosyltransferase family 2 protein [Candidatus Woesebacteria bacterium]|nr:glycosyltransferase family 2 protein [Candidatus Woesebacteria bacterium]
MSKNISSKKIIIVIPAFNEAKWLAKVINDVKREGFMNIVVVDDGSTDNTCEVAERENVIVIKHLINRGPGAATQTGLMFAKLKDADMAVTIDADGQHDPKDIKRLIEEMESQKLDLVFGSRFLEKSNRIPLLKKIFNKIADFITFVLSTLWVSDSQTGLKVFSKKALEKIIINTSGFEFCTEIFMQVRLNKLKFEEVPIKVNYEVESQKKGQNFATGISTLFKLFLEAITK